MEKRLNRFLFLCVCCSQREHWSFHERSLQQKKKLIRSLITKTKWGNKSSDEFILNWNSASVHWLSFSKFPKFPTEWLDWFVDCNLAWAVSEMNICVWISQIAEEDGLYTSEGSFCGDLTSAQTYVTGSKSVTLYVNPERDTDHFNAYYDVLSQSHFLKRYNPLVKPISREAHPSAFGSCDITLHNCDSNCRISSPYYPSSYPRNMTCRYRVTFDRPQWRVALGGRSIDRYDLSHHADCAYDRLVVFEKIPGDDHYQEVAKFCGHGTFPQVCSFTRFVTSCIHFLHPALN